MSYRVLCRFAKHTVTIKLNTSCDDEAVPKKSSAIFGYKQSLLSIDMKTKVVYKTLKKFQVPSFCRDIQTFIYEDILIIYQARRPQ